MEWAEHQFRHSRPSADGSTEGDHIRSGAAQWARLPAALRPKTRPKPIALSAAGPPFPEELGYLWGWFGELAAGVSSNGFVPPVITWEALGAWRDEMDIGPLEPWEARALIDLGRLRAAVIAEDQKKNGQK